jgi:hypothetical protein
MAFAHVNSIRRAPSERCNRAFPVRRFLGDMTSAERDAVLELTNNPPHGSKLAAARDFGIDLSLLVSSLELTPTQRARRLSRAASFFDSVRVIVRKNR